MIRYAEWCSLPFSLSRFILVNFFFQLIFLMQEPICLALLWATPYFVFNSFSVSHTNIFSISHTNIIIKKQKQNKKAVLFSLQVCIVLIQSHNTEWRFARNSLLSLVVLVTRAHAEEALNRNQAFAVVKTNKEKLFTYKSSSRLWSNLAG